MVKTIDIDIDIAIGPEGTLFQNAVANDGTRMRLYGNGKLFLEGLHGGCMRDMDEQVQCIEGDEGP